MTPLYFKDERPVNQLRRNLAGQGKRNRADDPRATIRRLRAEVTMLRKLLKNGGILEDGFGNITSIVCPNCGGRTMQVVRPGKFQCTVCG